MAKIRRDQYDINKKLDEKYGHQKKEYYIVETRNNLQKLAVTDPYAAIPLFEDYIQEYPGDYKALAAYISLLITVNKLDEAELIYKEVLHNYLNDDVILRIDREKNYKTKKDLLFHRIRILSYNRKYYEAYILMKKHLNDFSDVLSDRTSYILFYLKYKAGFIPKEEINKTSYIINQTVEYSEEAFLDHARRHVVGNEEYWDEDEEVGVLFYEDFPLERVYEEIKKLIPSDNRLCKGITENQYYFKYDNCGILEKGRADYFCVITFEGTGDCITMYPVKDIGNVPYVDLNYLNKENSKPLTKRLSRVDMFNMKYNM